MAHMLSSRLIGLPWCQLVFGSAPVQLHHKTLTDYVSLFLFLLSIISSISLFISFIIFLFLCFFFSLSLSSSAATYVVFLQADLHHKRLDIPKASKNISRSSFSQDALYIKWLQVMLLTFLLWGPPREVGSPPCTCLNLSTAVDHSACIVARVFQEWNLNSSVLRRFLSIKVV